MAKANQAVLVLCAAILFVLSGCATQECQVQRLSEKEIMEQELIAERARQEFYTGNYEESAAILEPLCQERTISQPLYQCELGICLLAAGDKENAKRHLLDAYTSIESFFDPTTEKRAVSLWGAETEKVFKGEPYEQATLSLLLGLLFLEEGDINNALACFKNGQIADSDVKQELYKSDYGLLQLLEAKCYQMRGEAILCEQLESKAVESFASIHPVVVAQRKQTLAEIADRELTESQKAEVFDTQLQQAERAVLRDYRDYNTLLSRPYNTLLLVCSGRSPELARMGQYGEHRMVVKNSSDRSHLEVKVDNAQWYDPIRGYADVTFQAVTRGGREMDNVLADQAAFKRSTENFAQSMVDAANNTSDPYAQLGLLVIGMISSGISQATNVQADIRCIKTLPDEIDIVPLMLAPGTHDIQIDCYGENLMLSYSYNHQITVDTRPFQCFPVVIPSATRTPQAEENIQAKSEI